MKKIASLLLFTAFLTICSFTCAQIPPYVDYEPFEGLHHQSILRDGNYRASVHYLSHTGYEANYSLVVSVKNDKVTAIYFENGGSVHDGLNDWDYSYDGGKLSPVVDYGGSLVAMKGKVIISTYYMDEFLIPHTISDFYYIVIK